MKDMTGLLHGIASGRNAAILGDLFTLGAIVLAVLTYFFVVWERRQEDSPLRDDGQMGLKIVLYALLVASLGIAAGGMSKVLAFLFSGARNAYLIKAGLASLMAGGGALAVVFFLLLPRTNAALYPTVERFAVGYVALVSSLITVLSLNAFLTGLFTSAPWRLVTSAAFANLLAFGGVASLAVWRVGELSGWTAVIRGPTLPAGYEPQAPGQTHLGGYQPPGPAPGYSSGGPGGPPSRSGYPPAGGGYPPRRGGGYPPQGGSG